MRMRVTLVLLLVACSGLSGCIANMEDLKEALGAVEEVVPLEVPSYLPPLARAQANLTTVLVNVPVRFTSEGTRDPQALPVRLVWTFGDGASAEGATVTHAFSTAGEYAVRLTVTNEAGLADIATLSLQVGAPSRRPVACFETFDERGQPPAAMETGVKLLFDASCSADPDGDALTYDWDFGDGSTSRESKPTHAYGKPGLHLVRLRVSDAAGLWAEASRAVPIDYSDSQRGSFDLTGPASRAHPFPVEAGARTLEVRLTFPGGLGGNDLVLILRGPDGKELERTVDRTPPGAQDVQERVLTLGAADLARVPPGAWSAEVSKASGLMVEYGIEIRETF